MSESETNVETPLLEEQSVSSNEEDQKIKWEEVNSDNSSDDESIDEADLFPELNLPEFPDLNNKPNIEQVLQDFINDLQNTFPEIGNKLKELYDENNNLIVDKIIEFCKETYPVHFFNILYQNEELFEQDICLLPNINFSTLWKLEDINENHKNTIWKYLQLVLLSIVGDINENEVFGDTAKLFEGINTDEFKSKLESCIDQIEEMFKSRANNETEGENVRMDISGEHNFENFMPNADDLHSHLSSIMDGKIGRLANEIAEETAKELDLNLDNMTSQEDLFETVFKNPKKLTEIVGKISGKIDKKMKSGELNEKDLINEAGEMMDKLKNVPGMDKMEDIIKSMGGKDLEEMMKSMGGMSGMNDLFKSMSGNKNAKFNKGAFNQHMKSTQIRQRLKKKLEEKRKAEILMAMMQAKNGEQTNMENQQENVKQCVEENKEKKQENKYDDDWLEFTVYSSSNNKPQRSSINKNNNNNKKKKKNKKKK